MKLLTQLAWSLPVLLRPGTAVQASEADLAIPDLKQGSFDKLGGITAWNLLFYGSFVIIGTLGISLYQLVQIHKQRGIGVRELATLEAMSAPGMSKYVARLEREGLVERGPVGGDRRRIGLGPTEAGERVLRSVRSRRTAWLAARLRELEPDEIDAIDGAIEPLTRLLDVEA